MNPVDFLEDFEYIVETVERVHPRPDFHVPQRELDTMRDMCRKQIEHCDSIESFWSSAQSLLVLMEDGHTSLDPPRGPRTRQAGIGTTLVDGQVVVSRIIDEATCPDVSVGDLITGVSGRDVEHRLQEVYRTRPQDTIRGGRLRAARDLLKFVGSDRDECSLTIAKPDGSVKETTVELLEFSEALRDDAMAQRILDFKECVKTRILNNGKVGYLALRSCVDRSTINEEWIKELGLSLDDVPDMESVCWNFFNELSNSDCTDLIIDIRGNTGGNSKVGSTILKYLTDKPLETYRGSTRISRETLKWYPNKELGTVVDEDPNIRRFP